MRIEVWADVVCPWCYIGRARLHRAVEQADLDEPVTVIHRAFELDPTPRVGTKPVIDMLAAKFHMTVDEATAAETHVRDLATAEGLPYEVDRHIGNTFDAHRLIAWANAVHQQGDTMLDGLLAWHFGSGASLFCHSDLSAAAVAAGFDESEVTTLLTGERFADRVRTDQADAAELGLRSVPSILINDSMLVTGAQPTDVLVATLRRLAT